MGLWDDQVFQEGVAPMVLLVSKVLRSVLYGILVHNIIINIIHLLLYMFMCRETKEPREILEPEEAMEML